jgi:hypothetical protein
LLPEVLEGNKKEKRFPLPSGLDKTFAIPDNYSIGSPIEQHFALELALEFELVLELVIPRVRNLLRSRLWLNAVKPQPET